jgi:hypothetical protein
MSRERTCNPPLYLPPHHSRGPGPYRPPLALVSFPVGVAHLRSRHTSAPVRRRVKQANPAQMATSDIHHRTPNSHAGPRTRSIFRDSIVPRHPVANLSCGVVSRGFAADCLEGLSPRTRSTPSIASHPRRARFHPGSAQVSSPFASTNVSNMYRHRRRVLPHAFNVSQVIRCCWSAHPTRRCHRGSHSNS